MLAITVWLLTVSSLVYGGEQTTVVHQMFPTVQACEQVGKNMMSIRGLSRFRCVETQVLVRK